MFPRLVPAQPSGNPDDAATVRAIVDHWRQAWEAFDPSLLANDYAEDADFLNAFGVRNKGSAKIMEFVNVAFKRPTSQGRKTTWDEPTVRFIRPDVAIASRDFRTVGHRTPDGKEMPERKTHSTWVLTKDAGRWRIASQVIQDDNHP